MPHFTVVPVKDQAQSSYDSLEGINWVDYRDTGQDCPDHQDGADGKSHNFYSLFLTEMESQLEDLSLNGYPFTLLYFTYKSQHKQVNSCLGSFVNIWLNGYHGNTL
uniref:Uncharacterized protein n=1 Tax=Xiphophorus couchianus TaxID=32473 RepID=A0A3B5LZL3_9TELE